MPLYNVTAIARAGSPQGEVHGLLSKLSRIVLQRGGVVAGVSNWGVQDLAYRMKSRQEYHTRGRFMQLKLVASPDALKELERNMKLDGNSLALSLLLCAAFTRCPMAATDAPTMSSQSACCGG
jgi:ribosomal protein S6